MTDLPYGVYKTGEGSVFCHMSNDIYRTSVGLMNGYIIKQNFCNYTNTYYYHQKRHWKRRIVWLALPKKQKPSLQDKIKEKIKEKINQKRNLNVKLLNCEISINVNSMS